MNPICKLVRAWDDGILADIAQRADQETIAQALRSLSDPLLLDVVRSAAEDWDRHAPREPPKAPAKDKPVSARARLTEAAMSDLCERVRTCLRDISGAQTLDGIAKNIDPTGAVSKSSIRTAVERLVKLKVVEPTGTRRNRWYRWTETTKDALAS